MTKHGWGRIVSGAPKVLHFQVKRYLYINPRYERNKVLFYLSFFATTVQCEKVKMLDFFDRGKNIQFPNSTHYVTLEEDPIGDFPNEFTICSSTFMAKLYGPFAQLFSDGDSEDPWFTLTHWNSFTDNYVSVMINVDGVYKLGFTELEPYFNHWRHLCCAVDMNTGNVTMVMDGHVMTNQYMEEFTDLTLKPKSLSGKVVLGLRHYKGENPLAFQHKVGNLNVYGSKLSIKEMVQITNGSRCGENGDYLAWSSSKYTITGNITQIF